jgi:subtilisin family serine protease
MSDKQDEFDDPVRPRVVHIVLKEGFPPERLAAAFADVSAFAAHDEALAGLRKIKNEHGLLRYEASFSFNPPGLPAEKSPPPGRDRYFTLYFPASEDARIIAGKFNELEQIENASPARPIEPPRDPTQEPLVLGPVKGVNSQWYMQRCQITSAWTLKGQNQFFSGQGVVIADIDWGFRTTHDEFVGRIEKKYNAITGSDEFVSDGNRISHGTAVLGLLGAAGNGSGMIGVAYGSSLWLIQAGDGDPSVTDFRHWWFAIDFVRRTSSAGRPKVICLEGQTADDLSIESDLLVNKSIRDAIASGVVVCVPAGNGNKDAGLDLNGNSFRETNSILVGATLFDDDPAVNRKSPLSNWGDRVVVSAPGEETNDVTCGSNTDDELVNEFGRTSGATPKVAGTAALMLEANPNLTHAEIRSILACTGTPVADTGSTPVGTFLNAYGAVCQAQVHNN